ncbi:head maturation protease, ClpP-related [Caproicibacterium amylolyticum]|uniref:ATP-dependent Clp protease proteolytic subunit n=1 Tax=Caproicibacterium amylolyticum TaxID=2766537 RepID=A0A7G9WGP0_9FIRM|nr:head maturation protease, ClpP-related [Caproicibacterium amylolyticum]QNO17852.1 Clp protease ClpP [Caproicibacterium amylolyticum]
MSEQLQANGSQDTPTPRRELPAAARRKFWNFVNNDGEERTLYLEGAIADETWWGDEATPKLFKDDLLSGSGDITIWINSPGGDVFAAAQIYNMLKEYSGKVTVKIDGIAASAASVVAMSGDQVLMSPVSNLMIHNPSTIAIGDGDEMLRAKAMLDEVKESIINAYEAKSGQSRAAISHMMNDETWMNAKKAVELHFADGILYTESAPQDTSGGLIFSRMAVQNSLLSKFPAKKPLPKVSATERESRLNLLK